MPNSAQPVDRLRFTLVAIGAALLVFVLDVLFHGTLAQDMYAGYPSRPMAEVQALFPFLLLTYLGQLVTFCYMFLRIYPGRGVGKAAWWGLWGGLFVVYPNMQFFVAVRDTSWTLLWTQVVEAIVLCVLAVVAFELLYRPRPQPSPAS